jgi:hypothetical protein
MIDHWNFEIYILLDTQGINRLINVCQYELEEEDEDYDDLREMSNEIRTKINKYKANLRKLYIRDGYVKSFKLNSNIFKIT